ncbi:MAG: hypothetical protein JNL89_17060 [Rhodanobacteraceae bacterium]|nr:hypothetical protein [Rhodanobacteraceae bacterium]
MSLCLSAALATLLCPADLPAASLSQVSPLIGGGLPAYLYDPDKPGLVRRRPGHPAPGARGRPDQNPTNVDPAPVDAVGEFVPVPDRWRLMEALGFKHPWYDPYNQNIWKGDKPIHDDWFLSLLAISDTLMEPRSIPTPVGAQASDNPGAVDIFSGFDQTILAQTVLAGLVYYKGNTTFKPPEYEYRLTLAFNYNRVEVDDVRALTIDPRKGTVRDDGFVAIQEVFADIHLRDVSPRYDFDAIRFGIQPFSSDFRGFLFQDLQFGVRLFGNRDNNHRQYNLAWFRRVEKDLNSGLNDVAEGLRDDDIFIANYYWQDLFGILGLMQQGTIAWNRNREDELFFDSNGFIQRPSSLGTEQFREYDAIYLGHNADGHLGAYNVSTSAYYVFGDNKNTFTGRDSDIRAGFFAAEISRDYDWIRPRLSIAYASGDDDPFDDKSTGYDAIFENPIFAGADTSYWIRQNIPLIGGGGVTLAPRNGILPSMRPSKEQGQSNFENPGLHLIGVGADFDLTPESRVSFNLNQMWFDDTAVLEVARNQAPIDREIGTDLSVAWIWRPYMTQNIVVRLSGAVLEPGSGLEDLYGERDPFYTVLGNVILSY